MNTGSTRISIGGHWQRLVVAIAVGTMVLTVAPGTVGAAGGARHVTAVQSFAFTPSGGVRVATFGKATLRMYPGGPGASTRTTLQLVLTKLPAGAPLTVSIEHGVCFAASDPSQAWARFAARSSSAGALSRMFILTPNQRRAVDLAMRGRQVVVWVSSGPFHACGAFS